MILPICLILLLSPHWVGPSFQVLSTLPNQLHHTPGMQQHEAASNPSLDSESYPLGPSFKCLRTSIGISLEVWVPVLQPLPDFYVYDPYLLLFDPQPQEWKLLPGVTISVTTLSLFTFDPSIPLEPISFITFSAKITSVVYLFLGLYGYRLAFILMQTYINKKMVTMIRKNNNQMKK